MKTLHKKLIGVTSIVALYMLGFYSVANAIWHSEENITLTTGLDDLTYGTLVIMFPFLLLISLISMVFLTHEPKDRGSL